MAVHLLLVALVGLGPVFLFLATLIYLDSFKLVSLPAVTVVMILGALMAALSYFIAGPVMDVLHLSFEQYSRYAAPVVEETLKAAIIVGLVARNRIGFMIDAVILGMAVGGGFAVFENTYYALVFPDANLGVWIVRGLGTAMMHSATTALLGMTAHTLSERHSTINPINFLPGLAAAIALHSIYNQFTPWPLQSTAAMIFAVPLLILFGLDKSEHQAHEWLIHDYDSHVDLLRAIRDGTFAHSKAGRLIETLAERFGEGVVADIFAYLSLHTRLVLDAEKMLLAREKGLSEMPDPADAAEFAELRERERKIGRTARLALWPHLKFSHQELWELHWLESKVQKAPAQPA